MTLPAAGDVATHVLPLDPAQRARLEHFSIGQSVDLHCHCLPGLDDGPATAGESLELCRALARDGITTVIATPHQLGRYTGSNDAPSVRIAVEAVNRSLVTAGVPLHVLPGADVRVDEELPRLLLQDRILTLADRGIYVLLELPSTTAIDPSRLLQKLAQIGKRAIISHPERYRWLAARPEAVDRWISLGAVMQLTAGSFCGDFGNSAQRAAWYWLETGRASLVATDAHNVTKRPPRMTEAIRLITARLGAATVRRVCVENPWRVLQGQDLETPPQRKDSPDLIDDLNFD